MDLFERVSEDIKNAMRAKDKVALETLRNIKKVFLEAKTAPGANDTLTDADALKIIQKLTKQGKDAAEIYVQQGRQDLADAELAQVKVMEAYLPKQMSPEELEAALLLMLQIHDRFNTVNQVLLSFLPKTFCLCLTFLGTVFLHTASWHECLATKFTFSCRSHTL